MTEDINGDCMFMALQIIQSVGIDGKAIPPILTRHEQNPDNFKDALVLFGVGRSRMNNGNHRFHCWIEIGEYVIDYSNEQQIFVTRNVFRRSNNVRVSMSLDWTGVCSLLLDKLPPSEWVRLSQEDLYQVVLKNQEKVSSWQPIDFLSAHHNQQNPFQ